MEFILIKSTAMPVLTQALKTCNTKANDADACFLLKEKDGNLTVTSLDAQSEQTINLPVVQLKSTDDEAFSVLGQSIVDFLKQFPDEEARCSFDNSTSILTISGTVKDVKFEFACGAEEDFVLFNYAQGNVAVACDAKSLANALHLTAFSASTDIGAAPWTAVAVNIKDDQLVAKSSNQERVSIVEIETEDCSNPIEFLLPQTTANALGILLNSVDTVKIEMSQNKAHIRFYWGDTIFTSRLESSREPYPDLYEYIEGDTVAEVTVSRVDLLNAIKLIGFLARDSYVAISASSDGVRLSANEKDKGNGTNLVEAQTAKGSADLLVPYKYLLKGVEMTFSPWIDLQFVELTNFNNFCGLCLVDDTFKHFLFPAMSNDPVVDDTVADDTEEEAED